MNHDKQQRLIDTAQAMNAAGLNPGTAGNLSVRDGNGMLITPSGMEYAGLSVDDIVWVGLDKCFPLLMVGIEILLDLLRTAARQLPQPDGEFARALETQFHGDLEAMVRSRPG